MSSSALYSCESVPLLGKIMCFFYLAYQLATPGEGSTCPYPTHMYIIISFLLCDVTIRPVRTVPVRLCWNFFPYHLLPATLNMIRQDNRKLCSKGTAQPTKFVYCSCSKGPSMHHIGQGVTKRCRLQYLGWLAPSYMSPNSGGEGGVAGSQPLSTALHSSPKINFGDLTPYLTCDNGKAKLLPGFGRGWDTSVRDIWSMGHII